MIKWLVYLIISDDPFWNLSLFQKDTCTYQNLFLVEKWGVAFLGNSLEMYLIILWNNNIKDTCSNFNQFASNIASRTCQGTKDILLTLLADAGTCTTSSLCDNRDSTYRNRKTQVNEDRKWSNRCPVHLFNFRGPSGRADGRGSKERDVYSYNFNKLNKATCFWWKYQECLKIEEHPLHQYWYV